MLDTPDSESVAHCQISQCEGYHAGRKLILWDILPTAIRPMDTGQPTHDQAQERQHQTPCNSIPNLAAGRGSECRHSTGLLPGRPVHIHITRHHGRGGPGRQDRGGGRLPLDNPPRIQTITGMPTVHPATGHDGWRQTLPRSGSTIRLSDLLPVCSRKEIQQIASKLRHIVGCRRLKHQDGRYSRSLANSATLLDVSNLRGAS